MRQPELIAEVSNDKKTLTAVVEQDDRVVYFYIYSTVEFRERFPMMRACWVRNLSPAPLQEDRQAMEQGLAPMLAAPFCRNLEGEAPLQAANVLIIWNESDDGAALWYQGLLLAVIPGWSLYIDHQVGYAAGCIKDNGAIFPLGSASTNTQYARAEQTRHFWREWQSEDHNPWPKIQADFLQCYEQRFGPSVKYYAIDQGTWPPMAISQHEYNGVYYFLTLGVSIRPMPWVEIMFNDDAGDYRRMEMAFAVEAQYVTEDNAVQMASALSGFAQLPWNKLSWLGEGHTLESPMAPQGYEGFVLSSALCSPSSKVDMPTIYDDKVNLYWATPVFTSEREFAHSMPNGGYELVAKLIAQGNNHVFVPREAVC
ncbi:suppressor of fused domain protein [Edaphovirga cremea]|uniref:suppressor of fused domain protein n=1 Tax=Edaphovirga cremea TaxID=2267246 RepID=UPI003988C91E